jgi:uncharacterized protein YlxW (UPF0749 family)
MIAPFVLVDGLDVSLHPSLDALTDHVEAQDVRDGACVAFDAEGREVKLAAASDVSDVTAEPGDTASDGLRAQLINYIDHIGAERVGINDIHLATLDLASMLRIVGGHQATDIPAR